MKLETYLGNLAEQLHLRGVAPERITEIISEVESHLVDSDENPLDAFGSAAVYAENMAASAEKEPKDHNGSTSSFEMALGGKAARNPSPDYREEMEDNLWEPCGNWIVFHYFKRMIKPLK